MTKPSRDEITRRAFQEGWDAYADAHEDDDDPQIVVNVPTPSVVRTTTDGREVELVEVRWRDVKVGDVINLYDDDGPDGNRRVVAKETSPIYVDRYRAIILDDEGDEWRSPWTRGDETVSTLKAAAGRQTPRYGDYGS